jgi:hypothetical protein
MKVYPIRLMYQASSTNSSMGLWSMRENKTANQTIQRIG